MRKYWLPALILVLTALIAAVLLFGGDRQQPGGSTRPQSGSRPDTQTEGPDTLPTESTAPASADGSAPTADAGSDDPDADPTIPPVTPDTPVVLEEELYIELVGTYSGMYVEDGSGEIRSDVMMIVLRNGSERDLQLARVEMTVGDETYHFQCTNLPAGEAAVLLDQDRKPSSDARPEQAEVTLSTFFDSPMELCEDVLEIRGQQGNLLVTNISGEDITGDIYVYYKFYAADYYYGGITFRVTVRGGLAAGESSQLIAGHYSPDGCQIVQVTYGP